MSCLVSSLSVVVRLGCDFRPSRHKVKIRDSGLVSVCICHPSRRMVKIRDSCFVWLVCFVCVLTQHSSLPTQGQNKGILPCQGLVKVTGLRKLEITPNIIIWPTITKDLRK